MTRAGGDKAKSEDVVSVEEDVTALEIEPPTADASASEQALITVADEPSAATQTYLGSRREARKTRGTRWIVATVILAVLLVATAALSNYLWEVSRAWEEQVIEVDAANHVLGAQLAGERAEVKRQSEEIDLLSQQLSTAQQRITELADSNAQAGDNVQYYVQNINELTDNLAVATTVAASLNRCVEGHVQLLDYERNSANYNPTDVAQFEESLTVLCDNAVAANLALQREQAP